MNNGVFMTPGTEEEWTISIAHTEEDLQVFADALESFARDLTGA
jgi:glutamate-1-semialdehyde 2,1-aminomutase